MPEEETGKKTLKLKGTDFYIILDKDQKENPTLSLFTDLQSSVKDLKVLLSDKKRSSVDTLELVKVEYSKERWNFRPVPWKDIAIELLGVESKP